MRIGANPSDTSCLASASASTASWRAATHATAGRQCARKRATATATARRARGRQERRRRHVVLHLLLRLLRLLLRAWLLLGARPHTQPTQRPASSCARASRVPLEQRGRLLREGAEVPALALPALGALVATRRS
jgi:hypothetical protein